MDEELLEEVIRNYFASTHGPIVSFIWHGGEPMLRGLSFYRKAVELQKKYLPQGWQCWNNLQTNGLLMNEEWCRFLRKEHFDVGISIDGTRFNHDYYRIDKQENPTYDRIIANIKLLQKHGLQPDLLCTVNDETSQSPYEVYESLKKLNTGWMQFIPVVNKDEEGNVIGQSVDSRQYGEFLKTIFNQWLFNDLGKTNVQLFAEMLNVYAGGYQTVCWLLPECGKVLVVESDGKVYSCDHYVNESHCLGSIKDMTFGEMMSSSQQVSFGKAKRNLNDKCLNCRYLKICNGGCPKDRNKDNYNYLCDGMLELFNYADSYLNETVRQLKNGKKPDAIMNSLKNIRLEKWGKILPNNLCPCGSGRKFKHCCGK